MTQGEQPPVVAPDAAKMQELSQLVMLIASGLRKFQEYSQNRDRQGQHRAARDVTAAKDGLRQASGDPAAATDAVPQPMDQNSFQQAAQLAQQQPQQRVINPPVSLAPLGRSTWAVTGSVPGVGDVAIEVADGQQAQAMYAHFQQAPASELGAVAVTEQPLELDRRHGSQQAQQQQRSEYATLVSEMAALPTSDGQTLARNLRGLSPQLDWHIAQQFGNTLDTSVDSSASAPTSDPEGPPAAAAVSGTVESSATQSAAEDAATARDEQAGQSEFALGESVPGPGGRAALMFTQDEAMRWYPQPDTSIELEYRTAQGALVDPSELTGEQGAAFAAGLDPNAELHRRMATELYGTDEVVNQALENRFPGLKAAMRGHAEHAAAGEAPAEQAGPSPLEAGASFDPANAEHVRLAQEAQQQFGVQVAGYAQQQTGQDGARTAASGTQSDAHAQQRQTVKAARQVVSTPASDVQVATATVNAAKTPTPQAQSKQQAAGSSGGGASSRPPQRGHQSQRTQQPPQQQSR